MLLYFEVVIITNKHLVSCLKEKFQPELHLSQQLLDEQENNSELKMRMISEFLRELEMSQLAQVLELFANQIRLMHLMLE